MVSLTAAQIRADRTAYGRAIHLCGDSISRGYALSNFDPDPGHPLYDLRGPRSTLDLIISENGIDDWVIAEGPQIIGGVPLSGTPLSVVFPEELQELLAERVIRSGDVVAMEDAGPHGDDPDWYEAALGLLVDILAAHPAITVVILTTPSYSPAPNNSRWDLALSDGRTMNDVLRSVGGRGYPGDVVVADWASTMDDRRPDLISVDSIDPFQADGIHPNVWGQFDLVRHILRAALIWHRVATIADVEAALAAAITAGGYSGVGIPVGLTAPRAAELAQWLLLDVPP